MLQTLGRDIKIEKNEFNVNPVVESISNEIPCQSNFDPLTNPRFIQPVREHLFFLPIPFDEQ